MKKKIYLYLSLALLALGACSKDEPSGTDTPTKADVAFGLQLSLYGNEQALNEYFTTSNGYKIILSNFRLYISNIELTKENGEKVSVKDVMLYDIGETESRSFTANIPVGNYTSVRFGLGLDPATNDSDPTSFENSHPLAAYQGMYWSMLKYRFAIIEGRANVAGGDPANDALMAYHPGTDPAYRTLDIDYAFNVDANSAASLNFVVELNELFDGNGGNIDPVTNNATHSTPAEMPFTNILMDNLQGSIYAEAIYTRL